MTVQTAESLLSKINGAQDIRALPREALPRLCDEVRHCLIDTVSKTAGHLASGLGVVELTVALHYVFDTPHDILIWDVGHQAYPHKILTGHRDEFPTIRQPGGLHAFIWRNETPYDLISTGHASTSIGSALGLAVAQRFKPASQRRKVIAIIGDGAISGGCAFEALNHAGSFNDIDLTVILNDNEWSISENVGSIAQGLSHIISNPHYVKLIEGGKRILKGLPAVRDLALRAQEHVKGMLMPGTLFEEFGFNYMGPVDGHDINRLVNLLQNIKEMNGLNFLHIVTTKGKGYAPAEKDPTCYHGVPTFDPITGIQSACKREDTSYSNAFGRWMCDRAQIDRKLLGITPAMRVGSGMSEFAQKFPHQFFDVAIAEQHAMVFASGLAADGMRPVVNIYSSFMQRAYDGLIHDMAIQDLPIILTLDRGGVVGPDGPTHNGSFDIAYTRTVPNLVIMAPSSRRELYYMLNTAYQYAHPTVIRYPRSSGESFSDEALNQFKDAHQGKKMLNLDECISIGQVECLNLASFHQARLSQDEQARQAALAADNLKTVKAESVNSVNVALVSKALANWALAGALPQESKSLSNIARTDAVNAAEVVGNDVANDAANNAANKAANPTKSQSSESLVADSQGLGGITTVASLQNAGKQETVAQIAAQTVAQTSSQPTSQSASHTAAQVNSQLTGGVTLGQSVSSAQAWSQAAQLTNSWHPSAGSLSGLYTAPVLPRAGSVEQLLGLNLETRSLSVAQASQSQQKNEVQQENSVLKAGKALANLEVQAKLQGKKVALLAFGPMAHDLESLAKTYDMSLFNMRFIKPLNEELIAYLARTYDLLVTYEEGAVLGGIGEHIAALVAQISEHTPHAQVLTLGLPDHFIMEAPRDMILQENGLDALGILENILKVI